MTDDFGSRGDLFGLPAPRPDSNIVELGDRNLATVIIESFDSLTETFENFSKNIKPLTKGDVYDATKKAIQDSGLKGGDGSRIAPTTINVKEGVDIPELREYWKKKTEREIAAEKRIEDNLIKNQEKQLQAESNAKVEGFLKWTKEAMSNPLAFLEDFTLKKVIEPVIMKLSTVDKEEEEKKKKADNANARGSSNGESYANGFGQKSTGGVSLVDLDTILTKQTVNLTNQIQDVLHEELLMFGKALTTTMGWMFSGGQSFTNKMQVSGSPRIFQDSQGMSSSDIGFTDDLVDEQQAYDDTSDFINSPEDTELGSALLEYLGDDERVDVKGLLDGEDGGAIADIISSGGGDVLGSLTGSGAGAGIISALPEVLGALALIALFATIADKLGDLIKSWDDFRTKLPKWLGGSGKDVPPPKATDDETAFGKSSFTTDVGGAGGVFEFFDDAESLNRIGADAQRLAMSGSDYENAIDSKYGSERVTMESFLDYLQKGDKDVYDLILSNTNGSIAKSENFQKTIGKSASDAYLRQFAEENGIEDVDAFIADASDGLSKDKLSEKELRKYMSNADNETISRMTKEINRRRNAIMSTADDNTVWNGLGGYGLLIDGEGDNRVLKTSSFEFSKDAWEQAYGSLDNDAVSISTLESAKANAILRKLRSEGGDYYQRGLDLENRFNNGQIPNEEYGVQKRRLQHDMEYKTSQIVQVYQRQPQDIGAESSL